MIKHIIRHYQKKKHHYHLAGIFLGGLILLGIAIPAAMKAQRLPEHKAGLIGNPPCINIDASKYWGRRGVYPGTNHIFDKYRQRNPIDLELLCSYTFSYDFIRGAYKGKIAPERIIGGGANHGSAPEDTGPMCGDNHRDPGEECDGENDCVKCHSVQITLDLMKILKQARGLKTDIELTDKNKKIVSEGMKIIMESNKGNASFSATLAHLTRVQRDKILQDTTLTVSQKLYLKSLYEYLLFMIANY